MKKYLIKGILVLSGVLTILMIIVNYIKEKKVNTYKMLADKHLRIMQSMNQWLILRQEGKTIRNYFEVSGYKQIAIYGMSYLGERLYDELKSSVIEVKYVIDKNADMIYSQVEVFEPQDELPEADAIVVTAISFFDEIKDQLSVKVNCPIISLEDILFMDGESI